MANLNLNFCLTDDDTLENTADESNRFLCTNFGQLFCAMLPCCNYQPCIFDRKIRKLRCQVQGFRKQISNASHNKLLEFKSGQTSSCLSVISYECVVGVALALL